MSYFTSDSSTIERLKQRQLAAQYREQATPTTDIVSLISRWTQFYPDLPAGVIVPMAQAGMDPTSPEAQQIADASFEQQRQDGFFDKVGDVIGTVTKPVGAAVSAVGGLLDTALGPVDEELTPTFRDAVRTGFVVLESPWQELNTIVRAGGWAGVRLAEEQGDTSILNRLRNIVDPTRWDDYSRVFSEAYTHAGSSSLRELLGGADPGEGWLPGGEADERRRAKDAQLTLKIRGHQFGGPGNNGITPGGVIAARVFEPGETAFNILSGTIDAGRLWFGDPVIALGAAARTGQAGKRVGRAGRALRDDGVRAAAGELATRPTLAPIRDRSYQGRAAEWLSDNVTGRLPGFRNTILPDVTEQWIQKGGRRVVEKMADTDNFYDLWQATNKKLGVKLTKDIADARTPDDVLTLLRPNLGTQLRDSPEFLGFKVRAANRTNLRITQGMPGSFLDPNDLDGTVEQIDRWLRNAKVSPELRKQSVEAVARNESRVTLVSTLERVMADTADELATKIRPRDMVTAQQRSRDMTRMFNTELEKARLYMIDEIAESKKAVGIQLAGRETELRSPYEWLEYLNSMVPLPDSRDIRRATSDLGRLVDNPFFEKTTGALEWVNRHWKQMVLLRGAYTVRVVGEEQLRMAASDLDSVFAHPISAIAGLIADPAATGRLAGVRRGAARSTKAGRRRQVNVLSEAFDDDMVQYKNAMAKGWQGHTDEVFDKGRMFFRPEDTGYQRAWEQSVAQLSHSPVTRKLAEARGNLDDVSEWFFTGAGQKFRKEMMVHRAQLGSRAGADAYLRELWDDVLIRRTGGSPELMDAVASGRVAGKRIGQLNDQGMWRLEPEFRNLFTGIGPDVVIGQQKLGVNRSAASAYDDVVGFLFSHIATKPTNYLSRSPTFRQTYWRRIEEMLPHMDDATRSQAIRNADGVVDAAQLRRMRQARPVKNIAAGQTLTEFDELAKVHALNETKALLYDLTERSQFFDTLRLIFPFGEAWKEVLTRWARLGVENPKVFRRSQQIMTGARGSGFFHKDLNGEEVFTMPFSRQISKALIGVPVEFTGRVAGLSLMAEVLPGVGPVVQIPAAGIIPETPEWDWARKIMFPFGEEDYSQGILESFLPGWAKNARQYFENGDPRLFANTVGQVYDYLLSTGDYDASTPQGMAKALEDARDYAKKLYALRGFAQFFSPTSPLPQTLIVGPEGDELLVRREVIADLYNLTEELGYDEGQEEFVERYGVDFLGAAQGATMSIPPLLPVSAASAEWERANPDLVSEYKMTWGFFAPQGDLNDFDYQAYGRQLEREERVPLTPQQRAELAQARIARYLYDQQAKRVEGDTSPEAREWLAAIKDELRIRFPAYGTMLAGQGTLPGLPTRPPLEVLVAELSAAAVDPRLSDTRAAEAARLYLDARNRALEWARAVGVQSLEAQAATPARVWLADAGRRIGEAYPEFQEMFDSVFAREVS
jgi:hypothetical protein